MQYEARLGLKYLFYEALCRLYYQITMLVTFCLINNHSCIIMMGSPLICSRNMDALFERERSSLLQVCLLYTSDAADE